MGHFSMIDFTVIVAYMAFLAWVGLRSSKKVTNLSDYYVANRTLPSFVLLATVCASVIGGSALIGRGGYAYTGGMVSIAIALPYMIGMFIFSMFCGKISRLGQKYGFTSMPELLEYRFGKTVKIISAALIVYTSIATVGSQISATGTILSTLGGEYVNYIMGSVIATVIFTAYTASSGMFGVVYTDVVQFIVLILSVYIMLPIFSIQEVGGFSELLARTAPEKWSMRLTQDTMTLIVTNFIMTIAGAEFWQRAFSAKDDRAAFNGQFGGTAVYGVTIVITLFIGLCAAILYPNLIDEYGTSDYAIPVMILKLLPAGMTGLAVSGVLSVMMSSADTYLLCATQATITDIYETFDKDISVVKGLAVSRSATVLYAMFALVVALFWRNAYDALMFGWTFYAATLGVPCLIALTWRKATTCGVLLGMFAGFTASILWRAADNPLGINSTLAGIALNALVLALVSLATCERYPSRMFSAK